MIQGIIPFSLLDYPGELACVVFLGGCNMRCPFCHNQELVLRPHSTLTPDELYLFLKKRKHKLTGVCISGGEPTLAPELIELLSTIKSLGFKVKVDTNGTNPQLLKTIVSDGLVDYIAMDIKGVQSHYPKLCGCPVNMIAIKQSIQFLLSNPIEYEFRTTVVLPFHTPEDFHELGKLIAGAKQYYLQPYTFSNTVLSPQQCQQPSLSFLQACQHHASSYVPHTFIRGIE